MEYRRAGLSAVSLGCWGLMSCAVHTAAEVRDRPAPSPVAAPSVPATSGAGCRTYIQDKNPPTNVRSEPEVRPGNIIGTLKNGTTLTVVGQQNSWLRLGTPQRGWVAISTTAVSCVPPGGRTSDAFKTIPQWGDRAIEGDRLAADLLARYSLQADGAIAEALSTALARWAQKNPKFLVTVLDGQPAEVRRRSVSLLEFGLDAPAKQQFGNRVSQEPPTSATRQLWAARADGSTNLKR